MPVHDYRRMQDTSSSNGPTITAPSLGDVKVQMSKKRKREQIKEKARKKEDRLRQLLQEEEVKEAERAAAIAKIWPHKCNTCHRAFKAERHLVSHACRASSVVGTGAGGAIVSNRTVSLANASVPLASDNIVPLASRSFSRVLLGHGTKVMRE